MLEICSKTGIFFLAVPPDRVQIKREPAVLKPGQAATLTCDSSSSNPPAALTWWRDGIPVQVCYFDSFFIHVIYFHITSFLTNNNFFASRAQQIHHQKVYMVGLFQL